MEQSLMADARRAMITGAAVADNPALAAAFAKILERAGESGLDNLLREIVGKRDELRGFIDQLHGGGGFQLLFREFGFGEGETADGDRRVGVAAAGIRPGRLRGIRRMPQERSAQRPSSRTSCRTQRAAFAETDRAAPAGAARRGFPEGRRRALCRKVLQHGASQARARFDGALRAAVAAIMAAADRLALFRMLEATTAALTAADWLIARYERMKAARGFLDFNDLITRTVRLLSRADVGPWVQYKLDQGIDHILIDEAQDTSPAQWDVVRRLAEEFFSGLGARDNVHRTVFAVGDEKQSIYSFQGADPRHFDEGSHFFGERVRAANGSFERLKLNWSFRSTDDILSAVDRVFADDGTRKGLTRDPEPIEHKAIRAGAPGYVEVWPSIGATAVEEPDDWRAGRRPCHRAGRAARRGDRHDHRQMDRRARADRGARARARRRRRAGAGAQARPLHPRAVAQPEEPRHRGGRRRPAEPARPYRGEGPGGARPRRPAAA